MNEYKLYKTKTHRPVRLLSKGDASLGPRFDLQTHTVEGEN